MAHSNQRLLQFGELAASFLPLDDRVMGGVSRSRMDKTPDGYGAFRGQISLENNGGFASVRATGLNLDVSALSTLVLWVRGDGRPYKLRLHDEAGLGGIAFQVEFETVAGEWVEVVLPLAEFQPMWRGRLVPDAKPLNRAHIVMVGLMVSDGQPGPFELELDWLAGR